MTLKIDQVSVYRCVYLLGKLGNVGRLRVLNLFLENEELNVGQVRDMANVEQSLTTRHLEYLHSAGILERKRRGKFVYYRLNHARLKEINDIVKHINNLD